MGNTYPNINSAHYYGGIIHFSFSSDEVCLTFCESYEVNLVRNQASRRHPDGTVQYFRKFSHSLQRQ